MPSGEARPGEETQSLPEQGMTQMQEDRVLRGTKDGPAGEDLHEMSRIEDDGGKRPLDTSFAMQTKGVVDDRFPSLR